MFYELVATIALGVGAAGFVLGLNKLFRGRLPRATMPVAAGLAMLGFAIWSEYSWYGRTVEQLPESVKILRTTETQAFYKPWTYVAPQINRMMVVDTDALRFNDNVPEQVMLDLTFMGRWAASEQVPYVVDCQQNQQAIFLGGVTFDERGAVDQAPWVPLALGDPLYQAVCAS